MHNAIVQYDVASQGDTIEQAQATVVVLCADPNVLPSPGSDEFL